MSFISIGPQVVHGSSEGVLFMCCFTWTGVAPSASKPVSLYTTIKQTFSCWQIFVPNMRVVRFHRQSHSTWLRCVLWGVLGPFCVLIGVGGYMFWLVSLMLFGLPHLDSIIFSLCAPLFWIILLLSWDYIVYHNYYIILG
jgi:hypothetical protein